MSAFLLYQKDLSEIVPEVYPLLSFPQATPGNAFGLRVYALLFFAQHDPYRKRGGEFLLLFFWKLYFFRDGVYEDPDWDRYVDEYLESNEADEVDDEWDEPIYGKYDIEELYI